MPAKNSGRKSRRMYRPLLLTFHEHVTDKRPLPPSLCPNACNVIRARRVLPGGSALDGTLVCDDCDTRFREHYLRIRKRVVSQIGFLHARDLSIHTRDPVGINAKIVPGKMFLK